MRRLALDLRGPPRDRQEMSHGAALIKEVIIYRGGLLPPGHRAIQDKADWAGKGGHGKRRATEPELGDNRYCHILSVVS